jgi:hypothetical protein
MSADKQAVIKPGRVGALAAFTVAFVVSYLIVASHLVMRGGGQGSYSSSAAPELKAAKSGRNARFAGGRPKRARPGESREVLRQPESLAESNGGVDSTVPDAAGGPTVVTAPPFPSRAPLRRTIAYLPGQRSEWTAYNLDVDTPRIIRAAGQISMGKEVSDPNGLRDSKNQRGQRRKSEGRNERALPSAPYLALIGRVCSDRTCSEPFFVGTSAVVCPSDTVGGQVQLQLRTNHDVPVDGTETLWRSTHVFGGFSIYAEAAPDAACGGRSGILPAGHDVTPIASGEVLRGPELRVPGNQTWWKPFFVPLSRPLLIRASGEVRLRRGATATGPNGIAVDDGAKLYQPTLPYHALIGRLCGPTECGPPFLVGDERIVCAKSPHNEHLELWMNHIIGASVDTFEVLQKDSGEYRFELSGAPAGACAPTVKR